MIPDDCKYQQYVLSQRQFYLRCNEEKVIPEFILMFFHSLRGKQELLSFANQTGVPSISRPATNLKKIPFRCPPIWVQNKWKDQVHPLIKQYLNNRKENEALGDLRNLLVNKFISN